MKTETAGNCIYGFKVAGLVDIEPPHIVPEYPQEGVAFDPAEKISAIIFDASGIQEAKVHYRYKNEGAKEVFLSPESGKANMYTAELPAADLKEGAYTIWFSATDKANPPNTEKGEDRKITVMYDKAAPDIKNVQVNGTAISNGGKLNVNSNDIHITGEVIESHGLEYLKIKGEGVAVPRHNDAYSFDHHLLLEDGNHTIKIETTDLANKQDTRAFTVCVDTTAPTFDEIILGADNPSPITDFNEQGNVKTASSTVAVNGVFTDAGSGLKNVIAEWKAGGESKKTEFTPLAQGNGKYKIDGALSLELGTNEVTFTATDKVGLQKEWKATITIENSTLTLELNFDTGGARYRKDEAYHVNGNFTLKAKGIYGGDTARDITLKAVKDGSSFDLQGLSPSINPSTADIGNEITGLKSGTQTTQPEEYTITFTPGTAADGRYVFTLLSGTVKTECVVRVDTKGPSITQIYPQDGALFDPAKPCTVSIFDISDIKEAQVHYKYNGGDENTVALLKNDNVYEKALDSTAAEGKYEIWFTAKDMLGNERSTDPVTVWYDTANPVIKDVSISIDSKPHTETIVYVKEGVSTITITGKATDANGIEKVAVFEGAEEKGTTAGDVDGDWSIELAVPGTLAEGTHDLTIKAIDKAGKDTSIQKRVIVDTQKPKVEHEPITGVYKDVPNETLWTNSNYVTIRGTAKDLKKDTTEEGGSGVDKVQYSVDGGTNWTDVAVNDGRWTSGISLTSTTKEIIIKAKDKAENDNQVEPIKIKLDNTAPLLTLTEPLDTQYASTSNIKPIELKYTVSDPGNGSGVKNASTKIVILNADGIEHTVYKEQANDTFKISADAISGLGQGIKLVRVSAFDNGGNESIPAQFNLIMDNTPPEVKMLSPIPTSGDNWAEREYLVGRYIIQGTFTDKDGSGVSTDDRDHTVKIGKNKDSLLPTDKFKVAGTTWTIEIKDIGEYGKSVYSVDRYNTKGERDTNGVIHKVPIYITTKDQAGNQRTQEFFIMVDSDGKTPKVTIDAPQQETTTEANGIEVHNHYKMVTLGGSVLFSGLAQTTNPLSGAKITEIQARFSAAADFTEPFERKAVLTANTVDWKNGVTVLAGASILSWSFSINTTTFLNNADSQKLYYSIRAKNNDGNYCDWTPARLIKLDKTAPSFENSIVKRNNSDTGVSYIDNIAVKGTEVTLISDLVSPSGINKITLKFTPEVDNLTSIAQTFSGDEIKNATINGTKLFTEIPKPANPRQGDVWGYTMKLPINTEKINDPNQNFRIQIDLSAGQANTGGETTNSGYFVFKYDNTPPVAVFGKAVGEFSTTTFSATKAEGIKCDKKADELQEAVKNGNLFVFVEIRGGKAKEIQVTKIEVENGSAKIEFADQGNIFDENPLCVLIEKNPIVFDNGSNPYQVDGLAYDTGSGVKTITATIGDKSVTMDQFETRPGKFVYFKGGIKTSGTPATSSSGIGEGKQTLKLAVTDKANNPGGSYSTDIFLRNNPLQISKVHFKTDLNANEKYENNPGTDLIEEVLNAGYESCLDSSKNYRQTLDITNSFTFKNKEHSEIEFELTGGAGTERNYKFFYKTAAGTTEEIKELTEGLTVDGKKLKLGQKAFETIGDGVKTLIIEITDEVFGTDKDPTRKLRLEVTVTVQTEDPNRPQVDIRPLYWNDKNNNSATEVKKDGTGRVISSTVVGHVELVKVSGGSGDFDVSGKVVLRGSAYHTTRLTNITLTLPDTTKAKSDYVQGNWKSTDGLTVTDMRLDHKGHWVTWEYIWDTPAVGFGKSITVKATGSGNGVSEDTDKPLHATTVTRQNTTSAVAARSAGGSGQSLPKLVPGQFVRFDKGEESYFVAIREVTNTEDKNAGTTTASFSWDGAVQVPTDITSAYIYPIDCTNTTPVYNKSKLTVNVVPYITGIETSNRTKSGLNSNTIRSSSGKYSIMKGSTNNFILVKGFNFGTATGNVTVRLVKEGDKNTANQNTGSGITVNSVDPSGIKLSNNISESGYLEVFVKVGASYIRALNNINDNTKQYNKEEDTIVLKNKTLTDDRYLRLFDMKETKIKNGYYPEMIMDSDDPVFGYIDPSGYHEIKDENLKKLAFFVASGYKFQRAKFNAQNGSIKEIEYLAGAIAWDQLAMAKDKAGKYHHLSVYNYAGARMCYIYDRYGELAKWKRNRTEYTDGWGPGAGYVNYEGVFAQNPNNNALALDLVGIAVDRYMYPKLLVKENGTDINTVYMACYDNEGYKIFFRNFQIGPKDGNRSHQLYEKTKWTNLNEGDSNASRQEAATNASPYFDIGVTSDNRVILVYFDEGAGKLQLKYSTKPVDGSNPTANVEWTVPMLDFPDYVGTYVSLDIDDNDGIHIAAFDSGDGDLMYFYLPTNSTKLQSMKVDAAFSVGQWTQVKVYNNKPYIAYYNNTEAGQRSAIKLAIPNAKIGSIEEGVDKNGFVTGKWECMTVPTLKPAQGGNPKFKKVNLGFDSKGVPVLGYLSENLEFGKYLGEE
ncbi:MAG: Ig-like domain-containing protein [Treponema phagedenis]|uniref:Ig-like domain-containing protein n=1 Tax=Treponema phagedenis TaxID=162 RepID=UPI003133F727